MTKEEAANKMIRMRCLFEGLETVEWIEPMPSVPGGATDRRILRQTHMRAKP